MLKRVVAGVVAGARAEAAIGKTADPRTIAVAIGRTGKRKTMEAAGRTPMVPRVAVTTGVAVRTGNPAVEVGAVVAGIGNPVVVVVVVVVASLGTAAGPQVVAVGAPGSQGQTTIHLTARVVVAMAASPMTSMKTSMGAANLTTMVASLPMVEGGTTMAAEEAGAVVAAARTMVATMVVVATEEAATTLATGIAGGTRHHQLGEEEDQEEEMEGGALLSLAIWMACALTAETWRVPSAQWAESRVLR